LPEILWIGNSLTVRQDAIRKINISQVTSSALRACVEILNIPLGIELVEQGLATTFQQILDLKANLDFLPQADADKLQLLSSQLYSGASENPKSIASQRNEFLGELRSKPHLKDFLRPKPYAALCEASQDGPVVIFNSHSDHCDAIVLIRPTVDPIHVPLPDVTVDALQQQKKALREIIDGCNIRMRDTESSRLQGKREGSMPSFEQLLAWIWTNIVQHIYKTLELVSHKIK
jgi:hypothetical protein